ncbi:hypothetical protein [Leptospira bandrabouensis]|uniref:Uncharacterized protein n=1 Tax=Leptospira bandrabouensis TaxID=2484903 RepID=A0A6H3NSU3_9LEPT|nr:hypothetical protein [Leptospira bandrabouensis]TGN13317.1 hypothetical protein EHR08_11735 [Leptospira bandrabouensis]
MTPIHKNKSKFWSFIRPSTENVTLKELIDNIKNYAVNTGLYLIGNNLYYQHEPAMVFSGIILKFIAICLALLIVLQTWEIMQRLSYTIWNMDTSEIYKGSTKSNIFIYSLLLIPLTLIAIIYYLTKLFLNFPNCF